MTVGTESVLGGRPPRPALLAVALLLVVGGAGPGQAAPEPVELVVGAAASTAAVMGQLAQAFTREHPGVTVRFHHAASGALLQQIENGAPLHAVVFADWETVAAARKRGVRLHREQPVAGNRLLLVAPAAGPGRVASLADLSGTEVHRVCIGNPAYVPVGRYAAKALQATGSWEALQDKLLLAGSAAQAREYVRRAEVDAAVLYGSDALLLGEAAVVVADLTEWAAPQYFAAALVLEGPVGAAADRFTNFLPSPTAQELFAEWGFHAAGPRGP